MLNTLGCFYFLLNVLYLFKVDQKWSIVSPRSSDNNGEKITIINSNILLFLNLKIMLLYLVVFTFVANDEMSHNSNSFTLKDTYKFRGSGNSLVVAIYEYIYSYCMFATCIK